MGVEETIIPACIGCIADLECPVFLMPNPSSDTTAKAVRAMCLPQRAFVFLKVTLKQTMVSPS